MKRITQFAVLAAVLVAGAGRSCTAADYFIPGLWNSFFSANFSTASDGDALTDALATGGTWGEPALPDGCEAEVETDLDLRYLTFVTDNDNGIRFSPRVQNPASGKACLFRVRFNEAESFMTLPEDAKGGFTVISTNKVDGVDDVMFAGYAPKERQWLRLKLKSGAVAPAFNVWYDLATRYKTIDGVSYVSYFVKLPTGDYERLFDDDDRYLFALPDGATLAMPGVMMRGAGRVGDFTGVGQKGGVLTIR